ncbi:MAG: XTP/dITP diphosphatase [Candidatus Methylacidiphilales bacterium]
MNPNLNDLNEEIRVLLATRNAGKAKELSALLGKGYRVAFLEMFPDWPDVVEDGDTFEANARKKAREISLKFPGWVLADDSGLEVDALQGAPGIYSARYAGEEKDDAANNQKLLQNLVGIPERDRGAQFQCVLALARHGNVVHTTRGVVRGRMLTEPRGDHGFGYDPLFLPDGFDKTTAEMTPEEKHTISHRGQAMHAMLIWLKDRVEA